jgi:hypothetical protein
MRQFIMTLTALAVFGATVVTAQAENQTPSPPTASGPVKRANSYDMCEIDYRKPPPPEACDSNSTFSSRDRVVCHCSFECHRKYDYMVRAHRLNRTPPFCYVRVYPVGTVAPCVRNCMAAKGEPPPLPRP